MQGSIEFLIRDVKRRDFQYLTPIGMEQLGVDYISDDDFIDAMDDPQKFCLVAESEGIAIGFAICREFGPESEHEELALPDSPERDIVLDAGRIGLIDSVAVSVDAVGMGVGTALCDECVRRFRHDGCDLTVSMAWVHFDGVEPIKGTLKRSGLTRSDLVIEGYWNQWVGSEGGHQCPYCGAPCKCFGAMWFRRLRDLGRVDGFRIPPISKLHPSIGLNSPAPSGASCRYPRRPSSR